MVFSRNYQKRLIAGFFQDSLALIFLEKNQQGYKLLDFSFMGLGDFAGSRKEILAFINSFKKKNQISKEPVYITIPPLKEVFLTFFDFPDMPKKEIVKTAQWQMEKEISFNLNRAVLSWGVVQSYTDSQGAKKNKAIFSAPKEEALKRYLSVIAECRLEAKSLSSSLLDYQNIIDHIGVDNQKQAILELRNDYSVLAIYKNAKIIFVRELFFSIQKIIDSLEGVLVSGKSSLSLSAAEARRIKDEVGIPKEAGLVFENKIETIKIFSLIRPQLEGLVKEIRRSFDYFGGNFEDFPPEDIYIAGPAKLKNLEWYLNREIGFKAKPLPLPAGLNTDSVDKKSLAANQNKIVTILGAGLATKNSINLLPKEIKNRKQKLFQNYFFKLTLTLTAGILLISFFSVRLRLSNHRKRLESARVQLRAGEDLSLLRLKIMEKQESLDFIRKNRLPVDLLLQFISASIDPNLILSEISLDFNSQKLFLKGEVLAGERSAESVLIDFVAKIEDSPIFSQANLTQYRRDRQINSFEIECNFKN